MKFAFNKAAIESLNEYGTHYDTKQPGLVLNVTANSKRFGVYKWDAIKKAPVCISIDVLREG